jgi:hypothetical protein
MVSVDAQIENAERSARIGLLVVDELSLVPKMRD